MRLGYLGQNYAARRSVGCDKKKRHGGRQRKKEEEDVDLRKQQSITGRHDAEGEGEAPGLEEEVAAEASETPEAP